MSASRELTVPDIGDFKNIPVIEVFVKPGDVVAKDAPLVTLESDKATLDVPSDSAGTIQELRVKVGDRVSQGTVIAIVVVPEAVPVAGASVAPTTPVASVPTSSGAGGEHVTQVPTISEVHPANISQGSSTTSGSSSSNGSTTGYVSTASNDDANDRSLGHVHASPSLRRFARELGVALGSVRGTGPNGRITRADVQNWVKRALSTTASAGVADGQAALLGGLTVLPWPKVDFAAFGPIERVPLSRIKKLSGPNLHRNWVVIPHVTQHDEADITELETMRKAINAEQEMKVTMLAFLIVASVVALKRFPDVNASLEGDELIKKGYYHIGFAADTPDGLVVPIIRDVDRKGVLQIAQEASALAKKARDGKLTRAEMQGGTFTISSLGGIGGTAFTPIINAPEVAILGASKSAMKPIWDGKAFQPRLMLPLSLSYDHRVIDGASAARFCVVLTQTLADLRRALL